MKLWKGVPILRKKNEKKEPRYIVRNITYGDKDFVDCMKAVIKAKLEEWYYEEHSIIEKKE